MSNPKYDLEWVRRERDMLKDLFDRQVGGTPIWDVVYSDICNLSEELEQATAELELRVQQRDAIADEVRQSHAESESLHFETVQENERLRGALSSLVTTLGHGFIWNSEKWICPFCLTEVEGIWEKGIASEPLLLEHEGDCPFLLAYKVLGGLQ